MRARPVVAAEMSTRGFGRLLLLGAALVALQHLAYAFTLHPEVFQGALVDTDAYLRLARVAELRHGGDWFSPLLARVRPPAPPKAGGRHRVRGAWSPPGELGASLLPRPPLLPGPQGESELRRTCSPCPPWMSVATPGRPLGRILRNTPRDD